MKNYSTLLSVSAILLLSWGIAAIVVGQNRSDHYRALAHDAYVLDYPSSALHFYRESKSVWVLPTVLGVFLIAGSITLGAILLRRNQHGGRARDFDF